MQGGGSLLSLVRRSAAGDGGVAVKWVKEVFLRRLIGGLIQDNSRVVFLFDTRNGDLLSWLKRVRFVHRILPLDCFASTTRTIIKNSVFTLRREKKPFLILNSKMHPNR